ncbi:MAG: hypothetical protein IJO97_02305 [Lachnospiraceae bacterium]|nr:hypothetical protein [Lachnospiraceae bacterium]
MQNTTLKSTLIKTAILAGTFLVGTASGVVGMQQYARYYGVSVEEATEAEKRLLTDKIAIVNLDEGVIVEDEKVNYAEKLIIDLDDNFHFTGLEDARQGYATGIYAGYLVVPATFSESVVSLNTTPVRAEIMYAINNNLREDIKEDVIYDVLTLMNELNDSVSYMYLHSVLDEYHAAQDEAVTVMDNDLEEKEAIDAVQANDLVALVPVAEFTEIENNIEPVDISEYMMQNVELTSQVGLKYTEYLMASEEDHQKINEEAIALMDEMGNMSGIMSGINLTQDSEGNSVYQIGTEELGVIFEEHNAALTEKEAEISNNIIAIYEDINTYLTEYDRAVEAYKTENDDKYLDTLVALEEMFENYQNSYVMLSTVEFQMIEDTMESQNDKLIEQQNLIQELQSDEGTEENEFAETDRTSEQTTTEVPIVQETVTENPKTEESTIQEPETEESMAQEPVVEEPVIQETEVEEPSIQESEIEEATVQDSVTEGTVVEQPSIQETSTSTMQLYVAGDEEDTTEDEEVIDIPEVDADNLSQLQKDMQQILDDNYYFFSGYLLDEEGEVVKDVEDNSVTLVSLLEEYQLDIEDPIVVAEILEEQVGEFEKMDIGVVTTCVDEKILTPIQDNVDSFTTAVMNQYAVEQEQLTTYNEAIMEYNPLEYINHEEIQTLTDAMLENGTELSEAVLDTDIQQMEYVADVYAATREDLFTLQENIVQAKEDSDKAVEEGLQELKDTKSANSTENQEILYDFSTKLPYTRLGSLEYVQAYEFMVSPVSAQNAEVSKQEQNVKEDSVRAESDSVSVQVKREADYQNNSILIFAVICVIIVATTIKYHFHKKEESYEFE